VGYLGGSLADLVSAASDPDAFVVAMEALPQFKDILLLEPSLLKAGLPPR
jgi:hypothetical protein